MSDPELLDTDVWLRFRETLDPVRAKQVGQLRLAYFAVERCAVALTNEVALLKQERDEQWATERPWEKRKP